jgi:hypothetical protein
MKRTDTTVKKTIMTIEISEGGVEKVLGSLDDASLLARLRPLIEQFDKKIQRATKQKIQNGPVENRQLKQAVPSR